MTKLPKPHHYKKPRKVAMSKVTNRVQIEGEDEGLTGFVQEQEASDIEERYARSLTKNDNVDRFSFKEHYFGPARNTPGAREVDFMVLSGGSWWPDQIDGEIGHKTAAQKARDRISDAVLNQYLSQYGVNPVRRIPDGVNYLMDALDTQESSDQIVKDLYG